ncbi:MAG: ABC transporter permease [Candidatus Jordarchaeaceae archaeon]
MEKESGLKFLISRFVGFLKLFIRNKRAILGLAIILFFVFLSIAAPLIAPYDALGSNPEFEGYLSGKKAAPSWLKSLPPFLGGRSDLSENIEVIKNPGAPKLAPEGEWSIAIVPEDKEASISYAFDTNVDYPYPKVPGFKFDDVPGAFGITLQRDAGQSLGNVTVYFYKTFDYPYSGLPYGLFGNVELLVNGTVYSTDELQSDMLHVPLKVRVFFGSSDMKLNETATLYPPKYVAGISFPPSGFAVDPLTGEASITKNFSGRAEDGFWILSRYSRDSLSSLISVERFDMVKRLFGAMPGNYSYGIEVTFLDNAFPHEAVSTTIYIDDFAFKLLGTSFGLLGTDALGRDLYSQLIYGTRISLYLGITVAVISVTLGLIIGLAAGYMGGAIDQFLMRFNDLMLVIPGLPLLIVLVAVLGAKIENLIILLGFLGWNGFARVVRSQVLSLKERPFVEAAKAVGAGRLHIIWRHILPNVMSLVYVSLASSVPGAITAEAALSWLGFYDYFRMSWGRMLHDVFVAGATTNWWWIIPPGLCIALLATAFILLGFALDEILNPKLRMRR